MTELRKETNKSMTWVIFALGAALAWGLYGPTLHKGQVELGNPFRALRLRGSLRLCAENSRRKDAKNRKER